MSSTLAARVLMVDAGLSSILGLTLFFAPHKAGNFTFEHDTDGIHWHLIRCIGGQMLASAFIFYRLGGRSKETRTTCFLLRIISAILLIFIFQHARSINLIHPLVNTCMNYFGFISIAICSIFLLSSGWPLGKDLYNSTLENILYQMDSLASVTIGMAWISHPKWLLHRQVNIKMDESHEFCGRVMGVLFVCSQVLATHALYWRERTDRSLAAEARAFCCICILFAQVWSQVAYGEYWSGGHWVGISLFSTWTTISILYRVYIYVINKKLV